MKELIVIFAIGLLSHITSGYVYVVGPNMIRFNHDETVLIGVFEEFGLPVQIWLEYNGNKFSVIDDVIVENQEKPVMRTVRMTEADLPDDDEEKPKSVLLVAQSQHGRQETEILLSYNTGYLFIQTDKPIYTPRQTVKVRTLPLDESMRPATSWNTSMDLVSPSGIVMDRRRKSGESFFFKTEKGFTLPPYPEFGIWTIKAFYTGQLQTTARATFEVREYVLPRFGVTVDVDIPYILQADKDNDFVVTVTAEYVYKKKVKGSSGLNLYLNTPEKDRKHLMRMDRKQLEEGVSEFTVKGRELFGSPALVDQPFPTGSYLELTADVFESATGKEELGTNTGTVFAAEKYKFDFERSKTTYHPGMEYHLRVNLYLANGQPAEDTEVSIRATTLEGDVKYERSEQTDEEGYILVLVNTAQRDTTSITIQVTADNGESRDFTVMPYQGENQIQVEHVIKDGDMVMRAFTNMLGNTYTGMVFVIVSRGKIVHSSYMESVTQGGEPISLTIQRQVSPSARLLVFYLDKSRGKVVADSVKFNVEPRCKGDDLTLEVPAEGSNIPGGSNLLKVKGEPKMMVGLNVMDKALLLLKSDNVMRRSQMFREMESHDLGCGEGGGQTSEEIFQNAGLTLMASQTDFRLNKRPSEECGGHQRRSKRSEGCLANQACCDQGFEFAEEVLYNAPDGEVPDPWITCYAKARELAKETKLTTICIMEYLRECKRVLADSDDSAAGRSLGSGSDYMEDLKIAKLDGAPIVRKDFRESWLFEEVLLKDGSITKNLLYPDSITEWMIQGIGVSPEAGLCIAEPENVTVYKDFFIELDVPYKAVRMEHLDVKATIFNYGVPGAKAKKVSFYLEGTNGICSNVRPGQQSRRQRITIESNSAETVRFPILPLEAGLFKIKVSAIVTNVAVSTYDAVEKDLFVVNEGTEMSETIQVCLDPKDQMTDCKNHRRVLRSETNNDVQTIVVDLLLPAERLPGTGSAAAYLSTDIMADVVATLMDDVDKLFQKPAGCGEQTIIRLAPTVYAMGYLKGTTQVTPAIETQGNEWIRYGVQRERTYRKADGSYAAWLSRPSSTWLTAFVAKVFCQAMDIVDDAVVEDQDVVPTVQWFSTKTNADGSFYDPQPVIHREMIGHLQENDPTLTAFVMIAMSECKSREKGLNVVFDNAMAYVENLPRQTLNLNPYLLAISSYALALADSGKKFEFKEMLLNMAQQDGNGMYWGSKGGAAQANSASIETTSYALLTFMLFDDFKTSADIVSWLTAQRDARGVFRTTQDTVIGLQALSTYSRRTHTRDVNLDVSMVADAWKPRALTLNNEQNDVRKIVRDLPVEKQLLNIEVKGKGTGRMVIDLRYNENRPKDDVCPFDVSDIEFPEIITGMDGVDQILGGARICDVCGHCEEEVDAADVDYEAEEVFGVEVGEWNATLNIGGPVDEGPEDDFGFGRKKREAPEGPQTSRTCIKFNIKSSTDNEYGMSIVNFGLETGMTVMEDDLKRLQRDNVISRYEMPAYGKGFVIFYVDKIHANKTSFVFRLEDKYEGDKDSRQAATVSVYDYYSPERKCTNYYGTRGNSGEMPVEFHSCADTKYKRNCKCAQTICARSWEKRILQLLQKSRRSKRVIPPAIQLSRRTCDMEKANYAVLVKIESVEFDFTTLQKSATGVVIRPIHQGIEKLKPESEMTFHWKGSCHQPQLEEGRKYYIIAKDGPITKTVEDGQEKSVYTYPLMDTALVVEKRNVAGGKIAKLMKVMKNYENLMKKNKCNH